MCLPILRCAAAAGLLTIGLSPTAQGAFTPYSAGNGTEPDLVTILDTLYGMENLERMHDFGAGHTDQSWSNYGTINVTAVAKFASFHQTFGLLTGAEGGDHVELLTIVDDFGMLATPPSAAFTADASGSSFRFVDAASGSPMWSSFAGANDDGADHMITWRIIGGEHAGAYVIAWEDYSQGGDRDYNDLVLRVDGGTEPVPEPATLSLIGVGLVAMFAPRLRRRKAI